jgi:hypothetical protein
MMKKITTFTVAAIAAFCFAVTAPSACAQVSIGVQIGSQPVCPYGYFDYPPYNCAPFGYYGPQWFQGGVFLGAGPWYHGPNDFDGWVNRRYDPRYGYHGPLPRRGEHPDWDRHSGWEQSFHGDDRRHEVRQENENRDGQQQERRDNGNGYGQQQRRDENGNRYGEQQRRDENGNQYRQQDRHDNGNRSGQYQERSNHSNARDNGHDNNGRDNGHHDDDGH